MNSITNQGWTGLIMPPNYSPVNPGDGYHSGPFSVGPNFDGPVCCPNRGTATATISVAGVVLAPSDSAPIPPLEQGLVGYWKFDEGSGTSVSDSSGNGNDGAWNGSGGHWTAGKIKGAGDFNGSDDYVDVAKQSAFDFERTQPFTLSAWIKTTNNAPMSIISKEDNSQRDKGYQIQFGNFGYLFMHVMNTYSSNGIEVRSANQFNYYDGQWHHVTGTYDGSSQGSGVKLYWDGKPITTSVVFSNLTQSIRNSVDMRIGVRYGTQPFWVDPAEQFFNGQIDDARVYNRALLASEVSDLYNQAPSSPPPPPPPPNSPPNAPTNLGPTNLVDGSSSPANAPTFTFNLSDPDTGDQVAYEIQIDTTADFGNPAVDFTSGYLPQGSASFTVGQNGNGGVFAAGSVGQTLGAGSYYWRVKAIDNSSVLGIHTSAWSTKCPNSVSNKENCSK